MVHPEVLQRVHGQEQEGRPRGHEPLGRLVVHDQKGQEREHHAVVYGARLKVKDL
jgi:hypothetical protein